MNLNDLDISFMHNHTLYDTLHQIYVFYLKQGCRVKKDLTPDKSFKKTFKRKKVIQTNQSFQRILTILASEV